jgi:cytoskeletal protein CcmA (bactofilin family)
MFTTKSKPASVPSGKAAAPSILSLDLQVTGNIVTSGEVHVSGSVKGDITAKKVTIGEGGSVTGAIEAESALVAGALAGRLTAANVILAATARVVADITHGALTIEQGAVFEGHSRRVDSIDRAKAAAPLALA